MSEHPSSSSSWCLAHASKGLADLSSIYSVYFFGMRLFTNSRTINASVEVETPTDREHDLQDAFIDGPIMEEIREQNEERLKHMPLTDMCDPEEEKQQVESMGGD